MAFDFDRIIERRGTDCEKWDGLAGLFGVDGPDVLPLWVADMDFAAPPAVVEALCARAAHGVYGYTAMLPQFFAATASWMRRRHGWEVEPEWIRYAPGVVAGLSMCIQALTEPGDKVLFQSPVYPPIFLSIERNGRVPVNNRLAIREDGKGRHYEMDFDDLEKKLASGVKLAVLCSPHNPAGRVWRNDELSRFVELCLRHGATPVSDEIHHDLVFAPHRHTVLAALSPEAADACVVCCAPSKTFNIAGLQTSNVIIKNPEIRTRFMRAQAANAVFDPNPFGVEALKAAYTEGEPWLDALLAYLTANLDHLRSRLAAELPGVTLFPAEAMHLAWIDCSGLGLSDQELEKKLLHEARLVLNMGPRFGPGGEGFVRLNFACPRATLDAGIDRFVRALG
ncbi:aminotransferase class I and II [Desulfovibrio sp. X2]|uniref:MalY/PatB family protein n=1 Tax=Desulfovibrio sp. X2 TaxID=941449 RepID=UPI000358B9EC|nr:MalY/PatB family protein [Desulfovibrio sp. X2]EPR37505.1 aminotransferase class I and II [Desulfovibrio sp. X2]